MALPVIGITLGDQAGIGPEIVRMALQSPELPRDVEWRIIGEPIKVVPGTPTRESARAAWIALEEAAGLMNEGALSAVVTAPVSKHQLQSVGFRWPGQTEFFAEKAGVDDFAMCLSGDHLTVGLATIHESIASVPGLLNRENIIRVSRLLAEFCRKKSGTTPRIAIAGLNPHAGEQGAFGNEELKIIVPAVKELQKENHSALYSGPHVPDALFREAYLGQYDGIVCMYHDQGLIPLKMLDFDTAINITLGLPRPRLSPDHGTAFPIAGKGLANPSSMIRALQLAAKLVV